MAKGFAGIITLVERNPHFDLTADFGSMTREGTEALWPLTVSPNGRKWVEANLVGGANCAMGRFP